MEELENLLLLTVWITNGLCTHIQRGINQAMSFDHFQQWELSHLKFFSPKPKQEQFIYYLE